MSRSTVSSAEAAFSSSPSGTVAISRPSYQAYQILHAGFIALPVIAGLDKFFHLLVNWDMYLAPAIAKVSPLIAAGKSRTDVGRRCDRDRCGAPGSV